MYRIEHTVFKYTKKVFIIYRPEPTTTSTTHKILSPEIQLLTVTIVPPCILNILYTANTIAPYLYYHFKLLIG